jgi:acyl-CoA thioesterase I
LTAALLILAGLVLVNTAFAAEKIVNDSKRDEDKRVRILAFGDSLTAGLGLADAQAFPNVLERYLRERGLPVDVLNHGVSGETTAGGAARLEWSLEEGPDLVILELGANDAFRGVDPSRVQSNLRSMLVTLKSRGIPALLAGMYAPRNMGPDYVRRFDAIYPELAQEFGVPLYPFFLEGVAGRPEFNLEDGIHPNARGIEEVVRRIGPMVQEAVEQILGRRGARSGGARNG